MSELHVLNLTRCILDPIHGLIRFTDEELGVINTRLFQRLRKIRQNGLLHFIFPSATHTRFEHSLGVVYVADSIIQSLIYNSVAAKSKLATLSSATTGKCIDFSAIDKNDLQFLFRITRLSALVHDLGHGPLSHTFDSFAPKPDEIWSLIQKDPDLELMRSLHDIVKNTKHPRIEHEVMSCLFFCKIWKQINGEDGIPAAVTAAILGEKAFHLVKDSAKRKFIHLVSDIVSSAPADADRMDYLERDSRSCGVTYGLFDRERLLKTMLCYLGSDGNYRLGLKLSGLRAAENFVQARFELFIQVYYHKTNRAAELMLKKISEEATKSEIYVAHTETSEALESDYVRLGDDHFMAWLQGQDKSFRAEPNETIQSTAQSLHDRKLWKRIFDSESGQDEDKAKRAERVKGALASRFSDSADALYVDTQPPNATKDLKKGAALLRRGADGIYALDESMTWQTASPIIKALEDEEKSIIRIFYLNSDVAIAKKLREAAFTIDAEKP